MKPVVGTALAVALAASLTVIDGIVLARYEVGAVWGWLQAPVVVLAWLVPVAWWARRWAIAGFCLLATIAGLWGYFYLPPLAALIMAGIALTRSVRREAVAPWLSPDAAVSPPLR